MKHAVAQFAVVLVAAFTLAACSSVSYYSQAVSGQLSLLSKRRPIAEVLADPKTPPALRKRLKTVQRARDFASAELGLPNNASYRSYADLGRPYVVWNVFAAPELSLAPRQWCFPITGCVAYRGYFSKGAAIRFAKGLKQRGDDVEVEGITAYSTLGWFSDPVLNTMLRQPGYDLAALVFHELAHQELFVSGDTTFNESFATAVEEEGLRRWLLHEHTPEAFRKYQERKRRQAQFIALVMRTRERLKKLYASPVNDEAKRAGKRTAFADLKIEYAKLKKSWGGYSGYDRWFDRELNNASLVPIGSYYDYVPAFEQLLRDCDGDLKRFYRRARRIGKLSPAERTQEMEELLGKFRSTGADGSGDRAPASATPLPPSPSA
ncbi:MAG: aminopeptidase [Acidiferrobacteraceae bacterium]|jgi:predicted aminopeptidase